MAGPFTRRGVQFRTSPSSALSISNANTAAREGGSYAPAPTPTPSKNFNWWGVGQQPAQQQGASPDVRDSWMNPGVNDPADPTGLAAQAAQTYADQAAAYLAQLRASQMFPGVQPADQAAIDAEYAIRVKEAQLAQAQIDGDFAEAERLKTEIAANKAGMQSGIAHTSQMADPQIELALNFAKRINERNAPVAAVNTSDSMVGIGQAYDKGQALTSQTAGQIGAGDAALQAALKIASGDEDLYLDQAYNRGQHTQNIIGFSEDVGVSGVEAIAATFKRQMMEETALDKQHWADEDRAIAQIFEDLARKQQSLDLQGERDALQKRNAERALIPDVNYEGQNAYTVGVGAATDYITTQMGDAPIHRVAYLHNELEELFMDPAFQAAGDYSPQAVYEYYSTPVIVNGQPTGQTYADLAGLTTSELKTLADAVGVYSATSSKWQSPTVGTTDGPKGQETYRPGGEAPNNRSYADEARAGEGPYGARAQYVEQWAPQFAKVYGLTSVGQWRSLDAEVTADRSSNSDHYSGGAIDFSGSKAAMEQALIAARNDPNVSFAKIHGSPPHLHISFDIGAFS